LKRGRANFISKTAVSDLYIYGLSKAEKWFAQQACILGLQISNARAISARSTNPPPRALSPSLQLGIFKYFASGLALVSSQSLK
jgi:hypothetical protein